MTWRSLNVIPKELQPTESYYQSFRDWFEAMPGLSLTVQPHSEPEEPYWVIDFEGADLAERLGVRITRELDRPASLGVLVYPVEARVGEVGIEAMSAIMGWRPKVEIQFDADTGSIEQDIGAGLIALAIVRRFGGWLLYENPIVLPGDGKQNETIPGVCRELSYLEKDEELEDEELVVCGLGDESFHSWWVAHEKFSLLYEQPS